MLRVRLEGWSSVRCQVVGGLALVRRVETMRRGVRPLLGTLRYKPEAVRLARLMLALQGMLLLVQAHR